MHCRYNSPLATGSIKNWMDRFLGKWSWHVHTNCVFITNLIVARPRTCLAGKYFSKNSQYYQKVAVTCVNNMNSNRLHVLLFIICELFSAHNTNVTAFTKTDCGNCAQIWFKISTSWSTQKQVMHDKVGLINDSAAESLYIVQSNLRPQKKMGIQKHIFILKELNTARSDLRSIGTPSYVNVYTIVYWPRPASACWRIKMFWRTLFFEIWSLSTRRIAAELPVWEWSWIAWRTVNQFDYHS